MNLEKIKIIDLTHSLNPQIPCWDGGCGFKHIIKTDYADCSTQAKFRVLKLEMLAGIGTHMDAPAHCIPKSKTIDEISLNQLFVPCVTIDVAAKAHENYCVSLNDITDFENQHGKIATNSFVAFDTGWGKYWQKPDKYRNNLSFPSVSREVAEFLLTRDIAGLGIDTLSPDVPSSGFPVHQLILGAGKYIIENVANAELLPPVGAYILALPIKIAEATEAPIRLVALVN